jgi:hypothetical protein
MSQTREEKLQILIDKITSTMLIFKIDSLQQFMLDQDKGIEKYDIGCIDPLSPTLQEYLRNFDAEFETFSRSQLEKIASNFGYSEQIIQQSSDADIKTAIKLHFDQLIVQDYICAQLGLPATAFVEINDSEDLLQVSLSASVIEEYLAADLDLTMQDNNALIFHVRPIVASEEKSANENQDEYEKLRNELKDHLQELKTKHVNDPNDSIIQKRHDIVFALFNAFKLMKSDFRHDEATLATLKGSIQIPDVNKPDDSSKTTHYFLFSNQTENSTLKLLKKIQLFLENRAMNVKRKRSERNSIKF